MYNNYENCITVASSTSCAVQVVDNPTFDLLGGYALFLAMLWFLVWYLIRHK